MKCRWLASGNDRRAGSGVVEAILSHPLIRRQQAEENGASVNTAVQECQPPLLGTITPTEIKPLILHTNPLQYGMATGTD